MTNNTEKSTPDLGSSELPETPPTEGSQFVSFDVPEDQVGERLDRFISSSLEHYTRSRVKELIKSGHVKRAEKVILEPNCRIKLGDKYDVELPPAAAAIPLAENIPLNIAYEDEHLIVVDKPAGLVVHPATGHWRGTLVNALLYHCGDSLSGVGGVKRPGIVHRLDRQTSGLMVVAKNDTAHLGLSEQFADHGRQGPLTRAYTALVWGEITPPTGTIETQIGRSPNNPLKMDVLTEGGKFAITHYETLETYGTPEISNRSAMKLGQNNAAVSKITCRLETGRTHQIRVHMTHLGHPLIADPLYGTGYKTKADILPPHLQKAINKLNRQALHASLLGFSHPVTEEHLEFTSDLPSDMEKVKNLLKTL